MRAMTKSAVRFAREALVVGQRSLAPYSSRFSRHNYTQPQLFAPLVLKHFLRIDSGVWSPWSRNGANCAECWGLRRSRITPLSAMRSSGSSGGPKKGDLSPGSAFGSRSRHACRADRSLCGSGSGRHRIRSLSRQPLLPRPQWGSET